jgi:hypothetical protein
MAAGRACTATGDAADRRVIGLEHAFGRRRAGGGICAATPRARLDRGPDRRTEAYQENIGHRRFAQPQAIDSQEGDRAREPDC